MLGTRTPSRTWTMPLEQTTLAVVTVARRVVPFWMITVPAIFDAWRGGRHDVHSVVRLTPPAGMAAELTTVPRAWN